MYKRQYQNSVKVKKDAEARIKKLVEEAAQYESILKPDEEGIVNTCLLYTSLLESGRAVRFLNLSDYWKVKKGNFPKLMI